MLRHNPNISIVKIVTDQHNIMPQVIHSQKGKDLQQVRRHDKNKPKNTKSEAKGCHRKNGKYNVIIEDFVLAYNHSEDANEKLPTTKSIQKRKLPNDIDHDWNWAPYPRKIKSQRHDASLYEGNGYLSEDFENSQIVPDWDEDAEQDSACLSSSDGDNDDLLNTKAANIRIVTIDEVIEFDAFKSPGCHNFDAEPICFDIDKLCEIVGVDGINENEFLVDKQENTLEMLVTFANNSRSAICDDGQETLKKVKQSAPYSSPFDFNDTCEGEDYSDQLENDSQIEEFKFARCFKCRRKVCNYMWCRSFLKQKSSTIFFLIFQVYIMQDCPRHLMKETTATKRVT